MFLQGIERCFKNSDSEKGIVIEVNEQRNNELETSKTLQRDKVVYILYVEINLHSCMCMQSLDKELEMFSF